MNILVFNQDWFVREWREMGHRVHTCGLQPEAEFQPSMPLASIDSVLELLPRDFTPDLLVFHDNSCPILFLGLESIQIPTLFYAVDTHHHLELHRNLSLVFDATVLAQRDYLSHFAHIDAPMEWMPLWASKVYEPSALKGYDAVFVGSLSRRFNPERVDFFENLKRYAPVHTQMGEYWRIFPHAEIVMNQTIRGDLNFRVFEAMMSGSLLLTERSGNGLFDLFRDQYHLVSYEKGNVAEAADVINSLLANRQRCRDIGWLGREEILRAHLPIHRAERLLEIARTIRQRPRHRRRFGAMINYHVCSLRLEDTDTAYSIRALAAALSAANDALANNEPLTPDVVAHIVLAGIRYRKLLNAEAGEELTRVFQLHHPQDELLTLAVIRNHLNAGRHNLAEDLSRRTFAAPFETVSKAAEQAIGILLDSCHSLAPGDPAPQRRQ